jgi:hypothetical protein
MLVECHSSNNEYLVLDPETNTYYDIFLDNDNIWKLAVAKDTAQWHWWIGSAEYRSKEEGLAALMNALT